ncbi:hypothetical protein H4V97_002802 [Flavobacterium sp. CG_23.5]|nr:hypothetical protein [Flavobacterium sp. CG_23.5]
MIFLGTAILLLEDVFIKKTEISVKRTLQHDKKPI